MSLSVGGSSGADEIKPQTACSGPSRNAQIGPPCRWTKRFLSNPPLQSIQLLIDSRKTFHSLTCSARCDWGGAFVRLEISGIK